MSDDGRAINMDKATVAKCWFCDRTEEFDSRQVAQAWLTGHIQKVHSQELPAFENERENK